MEKNMKYKFVDIGTSHFSTSIDIYGTEIDGVLVEPIKKYLDVIPASEKIIKANYAISNFDGEGFINADVPNEEIYYASESKMKELKNTNPNEHSKIGRHGWGSLTNPANLQKNHLLCKLITFYTLCKLYDIQEVEFIKIDTEGHDHIILEQIYNMIKQKKLIVTDKIKFEYNYLSNKEKLNDLINKFESELNFLKEFVITDGQPDMILHKK
jgi:hypothetical protein